MNNKKILKQEKGAITLYVILAMFFFLVFIIGGYIIANKKLQSQYEAIKSESNIYEKKNNASNPENTDDKIPIYTQEQLLAIGDNKKHYIYQAQKTYTFGENNNYVLKDSLKIPENYDQSKYTTQKLSKISSNNNIIEFQNGEYLYNDDNQWIKVDETTAKTITPSNYGDLVNITLNGIDSWNILYNDKKNIYLIASNYIEIEKTPTTKENNSSFNSDSGKGIQFNSNIISDYEGANEIKENSVLKNAINMYYQWFNINDSSTANNSKICSYLLDTTRWSAILNNENKNFIKYIIGAPTIEMIAKSYNEKNPNEPKIQYKSETNGYDIKLSNDSNYSYQRDSALSTNIPLYSGPTETGGLVGMWLSSPSNYTNSTDNLFVLNGTSIKSIPYTYTDTNALGLRPVICLNSNVKLTETGNGTWIVNNN